jgi:hypothetical protein
MEIRCRKTHTVWSTVIVLPENLQSPSKHVIEGKIEETGRRGRRLKQLLGDLKEKRGCWILKEEARNRAVWRTLFGRGYGSVVRQTA